MAEKKLSFDDSMRRLDEIVNMLESGEHPLEEALTLFEEGSKLMRQCAALLDKAEQKVAKLTLRANTAPQESSFAPIEED